MSDLWIHPKCALDGRQASMEIEFKTTKGKTASYADARADLTIREPVQLWNCDDPKLYQVEIRIFDGQGPS